MSDMAHGEVHSLWMLAHVWYMAWMHILMRSWYILGDVST
jgi:hypothetical protein